MRDFCVCVRVDTGRALQIYDMAFYVMLNVVTMAIVSGA